MDKVEFTRCYRRGRLPSSIPHVSSIGERSVRMSDLSAMEWSYESYSRCAIHEKCSGHLRMTKHGMALPSWCAVIRDEMKDSRGVSSMRLSNGNISHDACKSDIRSALMSKAVVLKLDHP